MMETRAVLTLWALPSRGWPMGKGKGIKTPRLQTSCNQPAAAAAEVLGPQGVVPTGERTFAYVCRLVKTSFLARFAIAIEE